MRSPRNRISPEVGSTAPTRHEKSVVLPAPFGPMIPKMSPGITSKSMKASARRPPKRFEMPRTEITASAGIRDPPVRSECGGGERRHSGRQRVRRELEARGIAAQRLGRIDVLFDRREGTAERAPLDIRSECDDENGKDDHRKIIEVEVERAGRHPQAARSACKRN